MNSFRIETLSDTVRVYVDNVTLGDRSSKIVGNTDSTIGKIQISDGPHIDAFQRLKMSEPVTQFESTMIGNNNPLDFDTLISNDGSFTYDVQQSIGKLILNATSNLSKVVRQSHYYLVYQPGKGVNVLISCLLEESPLNVEKYIGLFDDNNGWILKNTSSGCSIVIRSDTSGSPVDINIPQSSWNVDTYDGNGPSGETLDLTSTIILYIDFEWLGVGRSRFGFFKNGILNFVHFHNPINKDVPYTRSPNLPIRLEIKNTGNTTIQSEIRQMCCSVVSDGGYRPIGVERNVSNGSTPIILNDTTYTPCLSIRLKAAYNRNKLYPSHFKGLITAGNQTVILRLVYNPVITGAVYNSVSFVNEPESYTEYSVNGTYTESTGTVIDEIYIVSKENRDIGDLLLSKLNVQSNINGVSDVISIIGKSFTGNPSIVTSISFSEF